VLNFFRFWIDCFTTGATYGNGVFGLLEIFCALLWVCYRKKDDNDEAKSIREDKVRAFGKWCFIGVFAFSTIVVAPYLKYHEKETEAVASKKIADGLSSSNSFLSGQIQGEENTVGVLQQQIKDSRQDNETALLNLKTDLSDANRQRDSALQRLDFFEANPEKLNQIYNNIFAHTPTNFDLAFQQFTNQLSSLGSEKAILGLRVNQTDLTNVDISIGAVVYATLFPMVKTNEIVIDVLNFSKISPAINPNIDFVCDIDQTNVFADGWTAEPKSPDGQNHWRQDYRGSIA
jgi:hypothetical protein